MKNDFFPKLERSLEDFLYEEEGNITRNKMVMVGSLVLVPVSYTHLTLPTNSRV